MERYQKLERSQVVGEGAYGVVYKAIDRHSKNNKEVALKKIRLEVEDEGIPITALREIILLRQLDHPNVVNLENVVMEPGRLYLVFELVDTDLKKYMDSSSEPLDPSLIKSYTQQILSGIAYCHSMGVMHRDLKPQNILVARDGGLKIADFGLARAFTPIVRALTVEVITRWYRAPEILLGSNMYTSCVDLWSVGCIVAEMYNKKAFFTGDSEIDQLHRIFRILGTPTAEMWPGINNLPFWRNTYPEWPTLTLKAFIPTMPDDAADLLSRVLVYNPADRYSAADALTHPFVQSQINLCTPQELSSSSSLSSSPSSRMETLSPQLPRKIVKVTPEETVGNAGTRVAGVDESAAAVNMEGEGEMEGKEKSGDSQQSTQDDRVENSSSSIPEQDVDVDVASNNNGAQALKNKRKRGVNTNATTTNNKGKSKTESEDKFVRNALATTGRRTVKAPERLTSEALR